MLIQTIGDHTAPLQDPVPETPNIDETAYRPKNFGVVVPKRLFRSALPSIGQIEELGGAFGLKHVVSLVGGDWLDEDYMMDKLGITHHQFAILQRRALTEDKVREILGYMGKLDGPILLHCLKGSVRTGQVVAGHRIWNEGRSKSDVILEGMRYGMFNISSIREVLKY